MVYRKSEYYQKDNSHLHPTFYKTMSIQTRILYPSNNATKGISW